MSMHGAFGRAYIDLSDGRLDGKVNRSSAIECHQCRRKVGKKLARCLYCGALLAHDPFS